MDQAKIEENRTAYDEFLARLDRQMRELLRMGPRPSDDDKSKRRRDTEVRCCAQPAGSPGVDDAPFSE